MQKALYLNGVFRDVLDEIISAQEGHPDLICYLQPYSPGTIRLLAESAPSISTPISLYVSTTDDLGKVSYLADIVGWENKQSIQPRRLKILNAHMREHQPDEKTIYMTLDNGRECANLISVLNLKKLPNPFSVSNLVKVKGNSPLGVRTLAGGWVPVYELPRWIGTEETIIKERFDAEFETKVELSKRESAQTRRKRLLTASKLPEKVQVLSIGYRRNPDVVVEVMIRANGRCERCKSKAPFLRAKDGSPYLETHHWVPLSEGGEDTVQNACALCPNCHRELHFGQNRQ